MNSLGCNIDGMMQKCLIQTRQKGLQSNSGPILICFCLLASRRSDRVIWSPKKSYSGELLTARTAVKTLTNSLVMKPDIGKGGGKAKRQGTTDRYSIAAFSTQQTYHTIQKVLLEEWILHLVPFFPLLLILQQDYIQQGEKIQLKTERRRKSQMLHQIIIKVGLTFCIANSKGQ